MNHNPHYQRYIDGLRGLSIISVVGFHLFPHLIPGGFVGVDIFFVISGLLITNIIINKMAQNSFNLLEFYNKRIRRIFPSLIIVLAACLSYGYFILLPKEFSSLVGNSYHSTFLLANLYSYREINYFDVQSIYKPLLHLWSLSIEEQFYLIFPAVMMGCYRVKRFRKHISVLILLALTLSFLLNFIIVNKSIAFKFFMPFTRSWEILFGALLASLQAQNIILLNSKLKQNTMAVVGIILVTVSFTVFDSHSPYPSFRALLPTLGACFILMSGDQSWLNKHFFSNRVLVGIGLISYPLYLVHWPIISFIAIVDIKLLTISSKLVIILSSIMIAYILYYFVERKIRYDNCISTKKLIAGMFLIMLASLYFYKIDARTLIVRTHPDFVKIDDALSDWDYPNSKLTSFKYQDYNFHKIGSGQRKIVFFGDSNIEQYAPRIVELLTQNASIATAIFTAGGSYLPIGNIVSNDPNYSNFVETVLKYIDEQDVDTIVIGATWVGYFNKGSVYKIVKDHINYSIGDDIGCQAALIKFKDMVQSFIDKGKHVHIILALPIGEKFSPSSFFKRTLLGHWTLDIKDVASHEWFAQSQSINQKFIDIASATGAGIIDPAAYICDSKVCKTWIAGYPIYKDACHIRAKYAKEHVRFLDFLLKN